MARANRHRQRLFCLIALLTTLVFFALFRSTSPQVDMSLYVSNLALGPSVTTYYNITGIKNYNYLLHAQNSYPPSPYKIRILVFASDRPADLKLTLESILNADYSKAGGADVDLELFVGLRETDSKDTPEQQDLTIELARSVEWPYGNYRIHRQFVKMDRSHAIMSAWYPTSDQEVAVIFEDDMVASAYWFSWLHDALTHYAPMEYGTLQSDPKFIGISLFRPIRNNLAKKNSRDKKGVPFLLQKPCRGAVYFARPWRQFVDFFDKRQEKDVVVPHMKNGTASPPNNSGNPSVSWQKHLLQYMYSNGLYMFYPNLIKNHALSTSHRLPVVNSTTKIKKIVPTLINANSLANKFVYESFFNLSNMSKLEVYNFYFKKINSINQLPNYHKEVTFS